MKKLFFIFVLIFSTTAHANNYFVNISTIPPWLVESMKKHTWKPGCPVPISDLRYVKLYYWGFDNQTHVGGIIIHHQLASEIAAIFQVLYNHHFPIEKMQPVELFNGQDEKSMEANNTSAFNCRFKIDSTHLSMHAYGLAIDINPQFNPSITRQTVSPANASPYVDRHLNLPGMITQSSTIYKVFKSYGWNWGGNWKNQKDYQHFEKNGLLK